MRRILALCAAVLMISGCSHTLRRRSPAAGTFSQRPRAAQAARTQAPRTEDVAISQSLRRAILADPSMSTDARNICVSTSHGVITLKGAVQDEAERRSILGKLQAIPGITAVENQLEPLVRDVAADGQGNDRE